jgi:signal transduction histidine kinase
MQKISILISFLLVCLITLLFGFLIRSLEGEIKGEEEKTEKFLHLSVAMAVNSIQDDISYTYRQISDFCKSETIPARQEESSFLALMDESDLKSQYGDQMLRNRKIVDVQSVSKENIRVFSSSDRDFPLGDFYNFPESDRLPEMILIDNFLGYMVFPLIYELEPDVKSFLFYRIDLTGVVRENLPVMIEKYMSNSPEAKNGSMKGFEISIGMGDEIGSGELLIDLNRLFNINTIFDFQKSRQERESPYFESSANIIANHLYLRINHASGSIGDYYRIKLRNYLLGLGSLYLLIFSAVIALVYTTYRVRQSVLREKEFTALISHELKTPLSVIRLGADNLACGYVDEKEDIVEYGSMIVKEADRLGDMIGKILSISGALDSQAPKRFSSVRISDLGRELEEQSLSLLISHEVELKMEYLNNRQELYCNRDTLTGAIFNILRNSIIYGASQSDMKIVELEFSDCERRRKKGLLIRIRDYGPGISWKDSQNIFKPYYRGAVGKENQIAGSGLGLSISRKILKQHRGSLQLLRSLKRQTVFDVWIPYRIKNE